MGIFRPKPATPDPDPLVSIRNSRAEVARIRRDSEAKAKAADIPEIKEMWQDGADDCARSLAETDKAISQIVDWRLARRRR